MGSKRSAILITGTTGLIGGSTANRLKDNGYSVNSFNGDITKENDWNHNLHGGEVVLLIAGIRTETEQDILVNAKSIDVIFTVAARNKKLPRKVVLASSQALYMGNKPQFNEKDIPVPTTVYGQSKLQGEQIAKKWCEDLGIPLIILRYSTVLGKGVREKSKMSGPLFIWTQAAKEGTPIKVFQDGNQTRDYIHVDDVALANIKALDLPSDTYNVGGGLPIKVIEVATWIKEFTSSQSEIVIMGGEATESDPRVMSSDISKLKSHGWRPQKTAKQAVADFISSS